MKPTAFLAALLLPATLLADPLSEADRQALLDQLDALKEQASTKASTRLDGASVAFAKAMKSDAAALALYLECVEQVDFVQRDRTSQQFREWKRQNRGRLDGDGYALALRHQLRWVALTMRAATQPSQSQGLAAEALEVLEGIYREPKKLRGQMRVLGEPVDRTVFARAYGLNGYRIEGWPMSPIDVNNEGRVTSIAGPFEKLIFPALRKDGDPEALRHAWQRRIDFEEIVAGFWKGGRGEKVAENGNSPDRDRFLLERKPELVWDMQEDLFKAGDQQKAAVAMLEHLKRYISHSHAREWESRFRELVDPREKKTVAEGTGADDAG